MDKIDKFQGEYRFLSNFYPCNIIYEGVVYSSVEHAYQAAKTTNEDLKKQIARMRTPSAAKQAGKNVPLREDWDEIKVSIMEELVKEKFRDLHLLRMLLETEQAYLEEGNDWGDTFWGVCNRKGENKLGKILMKIREESKAP
jgi:hypothetical protein